MTEALTASRSLHNVAIRAYRPSDHNSCRRLWAELTEHRSSLYGEQLSDTGAGFEEYLTQLNLSGIWVAEHAEEGVAGFIGLMLDGRAGEVDPVIVTASMRGGGIGQALLAKVADEANRRGLQRLTVSPTVRDVVALRSLHAAGFATLASVTLAYDVTGSGAHRGAASTERSTLDLFDLHFVV